MGRRDPAHRVGGGAHFTAAQVLCERRASTTPEETERRWREAVLTACGGMPHPGPDAVAQSTVRLQEERQISRLDGST